MTQDEFIIKILGPVTVALFVLTLIPGLLTLLVVLGNRFFSDVEPGWVTFIVRQLQGFKGVPSGLSSLAAEAFPALVAAFCFVNSGQQLTLIGRISFVVLLISVVVGAFGELIINPDNENQTNNITGGKDMLNNLIDASNFTLRTGITYACLLAGIKLKQG